MCSDTCCAYTENVSGWLFTCTWANIVCLFQGINSTPCILQTIAVSDLRRGRQCVNGSSEHRPGAAAASAAHSMPSAFHNYTPYPQWYWLLSDRAPAQTTVSQNAPLLFLKDWLLHNIIWLILVIYLVYITLSGIKWNQEHVELCERASKWTKPINIVQ